MIVIIFVLTCLDEVFNLFHKFDLPGVYHMSLVNSFGPSRIQCRRATCFHLKSNLTGIIEMIEIDLHHFGSLDLANINQQCSSMVIAVRKQIRFLGRQ